MIHIASAQTSNPQVPDQIDAPKLKTYESFDSLAAVRGIVALSPAIFHASWSSPINNSSLIQNGSAILDLFFILSGFVICNAYGGKISTGREFFNFMWIRLGRLYPMHLLMLFVFVGIEIAKYVAEVRLGLVAIKSAFVINNGSSFLTNVLLIHSLGVHDSLTYNFPSWTISVEFAAYIVFGALLLLVRKTRWVLAISTALIAISVTVLMLVDAPSHLHGVSYDYGFFRCMEGFFIGVLLCYIHKAVAAKHPGLASRHRWMNHLPLVFAAMIVLLMCKDRAGKLGQLVEALEAVFILLLVLAPGAWLNRALQIRVFQWLGRISYSVYMTHAAVAWIFQQILTVVLKTPMVRMHSGELQIATTPLFGLTMLGLYLAVVLSLSTLTFRYVEEPLRLKSRQIAASWKARVPARSAPQQAGSVINN